MATGNMLLGVARKKLGDVVFYRSGGVQRARVRVTPTNPRSAKQAVQRMVLATASKIAAAYKPIVDHSFEGVEIGTASVRHFLRKAMKALRAAAAAYFGGGTSVPAAFNLKGAPAVGLIDGLVVSTGKLSIPSYTAGGDQVIYSLSAALAESFNTQAAYEAELGKLGLVPGNQLTFLAHTVADVEVARFGEAVNLAQMVRFARVVFKSELPADFSGALIVNGAFNAALIERTEGKFPALAVESGAGGKVRLTMTAALDNGYGLMGAAVIRSAKTETGYEYSTSKIVADADNFDYNDANEIYPSYMDGAAEISVGDTLYLRNAVASPI